MRKILSLSFALCLLLACTSCKIQNLPLDGSNNDEAEQPRLPTFQEKQYYTIGETVHQEQEVQLSEDENDTRHCEADTTVTGITVTKQLDMTQWEQDKFFPDDYACINADGTLQPEIFERENISLDRSFVIVDFTVIDRCESPHDYYASTNSIHAERDEGIDLCGEEPVYFSLSSDQGHLFNKYEDFTQNQEFSYTAIYFVYDKDIEHAQLLINADNLGNVNALNQQYYNDQAQQDDLDYFGIYKIIQEGTEQDE